jgi:hypothetical protein
MNIVAILWLKLVKLVGNILKGIWWCVKKVIDIISFITKKLFSRT